MCFLHGKCFYLRECSSRISQHSDLQSKKSKLQFLYYSLYNADRSAYFALCSVLLPPCSHDKRIIDRDARHFLYAFAFQALSFLHKTWEVSLERQQQMKSWAGTKIAACKSITSRVKWRFTLEQPGVKAPGTAKRTPFFPLKSWSMDTFFPGSPSSTSTAGRGSPTCKWVNSNNYNNKRKTATSNLFISLMLL